MKMVEVKSKEVKSIVFKTLILHKLIINKEAIDEKFVILACETPDNQVEFDTLKINKRPSSGSFSY